MNLILHINIYIFPTILLSIIFITLRTGSIQTTGNRLFNKLLFATLLLLLFELLSWVGDGENFTFAVPYLYFTNLLYYAFVPLVSLLWLDYVCYSVTRTPLGKIGMLQHTLLCIPLAVYYVLLAVSLFNGWVFTITNENMHRRGPLFFLPYLLVIAYLFLSFAFSLNAGLKSIHSPKKSHFYFLFSITLVQIIVDSLQVYLGTFDVWLAYPCTALCEMIVFMHLQKDNITTDALTGINNRGCLDIYLKNLFEKQDPDTNMCLYMIDLDRFKQINDTYGHDIGDEALIITARTLGNFFRRSGSFVARYGGDEFCIVSVCENEEEARKTTVLLYDAFEQTNNTINKPYSLHFSVGYSLFRVDEKDGTTPSAVISTADAMMYERKQRRRLD